ncbi:MAG: dihydrodipicolinate synthase family protein [Verrucomicrobia bacterium]|nr:dihydrodipicolinate synthase family protein [Verrucomicrobiota bacterium]
MLTRWEGIFCALWTPTDENGALLEKTLKTNLEFVVSNGVQGLLALGSTGEFPHLDVSARRKFLEKVLARCGGLPVIANISDIRPGVVAELGRFARAHGTAAVAVLPPYFFPLAQPDLAEFFIRAGEAAQLPLFLYNFPERVGNRISLETIGAVADRVQLAGVKQSGAEFDYHQPLVEMGRRKNFVVLTGSDTRLPEAMGLGVSGCVSGLANAVPDVMREVFLAAREGPSSTEGRAARRMRQLGELVDRLEFPLNVAAVMEARNLSPGPPKSVLSEATKERYRLLLGEVRRLFQDWKLV